MAFDFPANPSYGQIYVSSGVTYIWDNYAWKLGSSAIPGPSGDYVLKAGDTMTGHLTLNADPVAPLHATTKQYVDQRSIPVGGLDGQALVSLTGTPTWGAPITGGGF